MDFREKYFLYFFFFHKLMDRKIVNKYEKI